MAEARAVSDYRQQMAKLDDQIVELLDARAKISSEIQRRSEGRVTLDIDEREYLERVVAASNGDMPAECLRAIFREVRASARSLERPVNVAYLGPEGAFGHRAAQGYFGAASAFLEANSVAEALDLVVRGQAAHAVFPFESSVEGLVQSSVTALAATELLLIAERTVPINYAFCCPSGQLADVEKVYTTAPIRVSCEQFIDRDLAKATVIDVRSPTVARDLAREDRSHAAILPSYLVPGSGLSPVSENVGDEPDLKIRFGVASGRPASRSGNDITCLLIHLDDTPGSLFNVLRHFAERGINVRQLHSRPVQQGTWNSVFYVEINGHLTDRPVVTALEAAKRGTQDLKILGAFALTGDAGPNT